MLDVGSAALALCSLEVVEPGLAGHLAHEDVEPEEGHSGSVGSTGGEVRECWVWSSGHILVVVEYLSGLLEEEDWGIWVVVVLWDVVEEDRLPTDEDHGWEMCRMMGLLVVIRWV